MFLNLKATIKKPNKPILIFLGVIVLIGAAFPFFGAEAIDLIDFGKDLVLKAIGWVAGLIINLLGTVLGLLIGILVSIAQYNHFVDSEAPSSVGIGWQIVRDGCNLLFVIGIMIIAFSTILKIQTYHARTLLVKFVIMAVIINFSKTITGLFIDFSQVVMLTFVNSFKNSATIVLIVGLNIKKMISLSTNTETVGFMSVVVSMILAVILLLVACCVVFAMIIVFLARIIMLWILVILSPIAYAASVLPNTQKFASSWWSSLGKNLVSGPLLAFFLWLSLYTISESSATVINLKDTNPPVPEQSGGASEMMSSQNMLNFIVAIALLITGLMMTQSLGVMGGQVAGNMVSRMRAVGTGALKMPFKAAKGAGAWGARKLKARTGVDINPVSIYRNLKAGFARKREQEEYQGMVKAGQRLEKGGLLGAVGGLGAASWVDNYAQGFLWRKGIQKVTPAWMQKVPGLKKLGLGRGKEGRITDMFAERDRRQKEIDEKKQLAEAKNPNERYLEARQQEKAEKQGKVADAEARIGDIDAILNAREKEAKSLEHKADQVEGKAKKDFDNKEIDKDQYEQAEAAAAEMREEAAELRTKPQTKEEIEQEKELRAEKSMIQSRLLGAKNDVKIVDVDIEYFKAKDINEQNDEAAGYFKDMADRRKKERERIAQGGLTKEQKTKRDEEIHQLDTDIKKLDTDIKNMKTLGKSTKPQEATLSELMKQKAEKAKYIADKDQMKANVTEQKKLAKEEGDFKKESEKAEKGEYMSEDQRMAIRRDVQKKEEELQKYSKEVEEEAAYRPIDFIAQQERRSQNEEAARKYRTENEAELRAYMKNALQRHNVNDAAAVALQAARVGHLNELVNDYRATEDWSEDAETGEIVRSKNAKVGSRVVFKKGDYLTAGIEGLHTYMNEIFDNVFKYGRKATLALENDLSETAKEINHWTFAEAIGSKEDGRFVQRSRATQGAHVYVERSKRDFENLYRQGNRLAIGTEEWRDPKNKSLGRKAVLNEYAVMELSNKWPALKGLIDRGRFNASAAEHLMQYNKPIIDYIQKQAVASGQVSEWRKVRGGWETLGGQAGEVRNLTREIRRMADILKKTNLRG